MAHIDIDLFPVDCHVFLFFQFTEDFQVAFLKQYHQVFDRAMHKYLIGELIWNFADFRTAQGSMFV